MYKQKITKKKIRTRKKVQVYTYNEQSTSPFWKLLAEFHSMVEKHVKKYKKYDIKSFHNVIAERTKKNSS